VQAENQSLFGRVNQLNQQLGTADASLVARDSTIVALRGELAAKGNEFRLLAESVEGIRRHALLEVERAREEAKAAGERQATSASELVRAHGKITVVEQECARLTGHLPNRAAPGRHDCSF
jgi:hypothetical protein